MCKVVRAMCYCQVSAILLALLTSVVILLTSLKRLSVLAGMEIKENASSLHNYQLP